jgi:hypothetical protein
MPRYEIVAHLVCELDAGTAEDAATAFRRQVLAEPGGADTLLHLAVWREEPAPTSSLLPASLRQQLTDFFAALDRCAGEAEATFRRRVEAILLAAPAAERATDAGAPADAPDGATPR